MKVIVADFGWQCFHFAVCKVHLSLFDNYGRSHRMRDFTNFMYNKRLIGGEKVTEESNGVLYHLLRNEMQIVI